MYKFFFLILLRPACAETSEAAFQTAMKAVTEGLGSLLDQKDVMRKLAIKGLLRSVSSVEYINETTNATLLNVTNLLEQIKLNMQSEATSATAYVADHVTYMEACDERLDDELENSRVAAESSESAHHTCRLDHNVSYHDHLNARAELLNFQTVTVHGTTLHPGSQSLIDVCGTPAPTQNQVPAWETHHTDSNTWMGNARAIFTPIANADTTATALEVNNRSNCNGFQMRHETATCGYIATHISACTSRHACWVGVHGINASSDSVISAYDTDNSNVPRLVRLIDYVICLVEEMRADNAQNARSACAYILLRDISHTGPYAAYWIEIPTNWPQPDQCVTAFTGAVAVFHPFTAHYQGSLGTDETANLLQTSLTCAVVTVPQATIDWYTNVAANPDPVATLPNGPF